VVLAPARPLLLSSFRRQAQLNISSLEHQRFLAAKDINVFPPRSAINVFSGSDINVFCREKIHVKVVAEA